MAVKVQRTTSRDRAQLRNEYDIYQALQGRKGIPRVTWYSESEDGAKMGMELLGRSVHDLHQARRLTQVKILAIADQVLALLEHVHTKRIIHCDIKPSNILIDRDLASDCIYMIDFGRARRLEDAVTTDRLTGTPLFASLDSHHGRLTVRGDLESLGYMLVYLYQGWLPWEGLEASTGNERIRKIEQSKRDLVPHGLCSSLPPEFLEYFQCLNTITGPGYRSLRPIFFRLHGRLARGHNVRPRRSTYVPPKVQSQGKGQRWTARGIRG